MPKKTRREKQTAHERRLQHLLRFKERPTTIVVTEQKSSTKQVDASISPYFKSEFRKSLLLIGIIIALEIILYYGTINNYFSFGMKLR